MGGEFRTWITLLAYISKINSCQKGFLLSQHICGLFDHYLFLLGFKLEIGTGGYPYVCWGSVVGLSEPAVLRSMCFCINLRS